MLWIWAPQYDGCDLCVLSAPSVLRLRPPPCASAPFSITARLCNRSLCPNPRRSPLQHDVRTRTSCVSQTEVQSRPGAPSRLAPGLACLPPQPRRLAPRIVSAVLIATRGGELPALTAGEQGAPLSQVELTPKVAGIWGGWDERGNGVQGFA